MRSLHVARRSASRHARPAGRRRACRARRSRRGPPGCRRARPARSRSGPDVLVVADQPVAVAEHALLGRERQDRERERRERGERERARRRGCRRLLFIAWAVPPCVSSSGASRTPSRNSRTSGCCDALDLLGAAQRRDAAVLEQRDAVGDREAELELVGHDHRRDVQLALERAGSARRSRRWLAGIEAGGRLVVEDHARLERDRRAPRRRACACRPRARPASCARRRRGPTAARHSATRSAMRSSGQRSARAADRPRSRRPRASRTAPRSGRSSTPRCARRSARAREARVMSRAEHAHAAAIGAQAGRSCASGTRISRCPSRRGS